MAVGCHDNRKRQVRPSAAARKATPCTAGAKLDEVLLSFFVLAFNLIGGQAQKWAKVMEQGTQMVHQCDACAAVKHTTIDERRTDCFECQRARSRINSAGVIAKTSQADDSIAPPPRPPPPPS